MNNYRFLVAPEEIKDKKYPLFPSCKTFMKSIWPKFEIDVDVTDIETFQFYYESPIKYEFEFNDGSKQEMFINISGAQFSGHDELTSFRINMHNKEQTEYYEVILDEDYFGVELLNDILQGEYNWNGGEEEDFCEEDD